MEKTCIVCSKSFIPKHNTFGLYCSLLCCNKAKHKVIELNCELCGVSFTCRPSETKRFCSKKCSAKNSAQNRSKRLRIEKVCLGCAIAFTTVPCENNDFCSQPCWLKYQTAHRLNIKQESRNRSTIIEMQDVFVKQREELVKSLTFVIDIVSGVYIIVNIENNMIYIGSSQDIEGRWKEHINKLYSNKHENDHLQKAWNKYGDKAFQFKILEAAEIDSLIVREQHYLNLYKPYERNIGYNLFKTAYSPLGYKWTEEQKTNLSEIRKNQWKNYPHPMLGRKLSPEEKETLSRIHKERYDKLKEEGKVPPQTGYKFSEEACQKMSEERKGRQLPEDFGEKVRSRRLGTKLVDGHWIHPA